MEFVIFCLKILDFDIKKPEVWIERYRFIKFKAKLDAIKQKINVLNAKAKIKKHFLVKTFQKMYILVL
jgi:hypothetical protein